MVSSLVRPAPPKILIKRAWVPESVEEVLRTYNPRTSFGALVKNLCKQLPVEQVADLLEGISKIVVVQSKLAVVIRRFDGGLEDWGVVSDRLVTNNGVAFIVDAFQNLVELEIMKFHGIGTGSGAEAASDSALGTELTTQYNPDNVRATGTTAESAANAYQTVGTNTVDATVTIQEHGILSQAAVGGGVLLDRSLTGGQALTSGDGMTTTYTLTLTAGG